MSEYMILKSFCNERAQVSLNYLDTVVQSFYQQPNRSIPVQFLEDDAGDPIRHSLAKVIRLRRVDTVLFATFDTPLPPGMMPSAEIIISTPKQWGELEAPMLRRIIVHPFGTKMEWD